MHTDRTRTKHSSLTTLSWRDTHTTHQTYYPPLQDTRLKFKELLSVRKEQSQPDPMLAKSGQPSLLEHSAQQPFPLDYTGPQPLNRTQNSMFITGGPRLSNYLSYLQQQDQLFPKDKAKFLKVSTHKNSSVTPQVLRTDRRITKKKTLDALMLDPARRQMVRKTAVKINKMSTDEIEKCMRQELQQLLYTMQKCVQEYSDSQGGQLVQTLKKFNKKLFLKLFLTNEHKTLRRIEPDSLDKLMSTIQRELFLNSQGSRSVIDYDTQNIDKLYQLIIFDIGYLQEKFENYVSMRLNQKLDIIQQNIIEENMQIINIKKDIVRNKQHLIKEHPEIKLEKIGKEVPSKRYRLEEKLSRLEMNNGKFKKLHRISRMVDDQIDEFSAQIQGKQQHRYDQEYFFQPIDASKIH